MTFREAQRRLEALEAQRQTGGLFVSWPDADPPRFTINGEPVSAAEYHRRLPQASTAITVAYVDGPEWRDT